MSIAKVIEISSESSSGFDDAIQSGIEKASKTVDNIKSAWVKDQIVQLENGNISSYRVHLRITFQVK
jgi:flavin-binding protein dodecin